MHESDTRAILRVVGVYSLVAGAWILFSDAVLLWITADARTVSTLQNFKGLAFVLVTAGLLSALLRQELSGRRAAEAARDQSQRFAAQIADSVPGLLYIFDLAERRNVYANRGLTTFLGYSAEQIRSFSDPLLQTLTHPEDWRSLFNERVPGYAALREGEAVENTFRLRHADGAWRWLRSREVVYSRDERGRPRQLLGVALDITRQKEAEDRLRESERRFRTLAEASPSGIYRAEARGEYVYVNERWCQIAGLTPEQARGAGWLAAVHPDDRERASSVWAAAIQTGQPAEAEFRLQRPDGLVTWVLSRAVAEQDEAGATAGYVGTITDITALKRTEARARRLARVYAVLSEINQVIVRLRERQALFEAACQIAMAHGGFRLAWISLQDQATGQVGVAASAGAAAADLAQAHAEPAGAGSFLNPTLRALREGRYALSNSRAPETGPASWPAAAQRLGCRSLAAFPLIVSGQVRGAFSLGAAEAGFFDEEEIKLLDEMALDLSFALEFMEREAQRQQAEIALRQSEARFRTFFEHAPVYCYMVTPDALILDVNSRTLEALGYAREELVGAPVSTLYAPASRAKAQALFAHWLVSGWVDSEELTIQTKAGAERVVLLSAAAVRDEAGRILYSISVQRDITERVQAEAALRENEAKYRGLFAHMLEGFAYCRVIFEDGAAQDWVYLAVNAAFETLTGLRGIEGKRVTEAIPGIRETDPGLFEIYGRVASTGRPEKFEMFVVALEMWFSVQVYSPEPEHFVAVFDVITERKRAAEALQRTSATLQAVVAASPLAIMTVDTGGQIQSWNLAAERIFGWTAAEVVGKGVVLGAPERQAEYEALVARVLAGEMITGYEARLPNKSGRGVDLSLSAGALHDAAGQVAGVLLISEDIGERKRVEVALRQLADERDQARRRLQLQFAAMPIGCFVTAPDLTILDWNPAAEAIFGYRQAEVVGRNPFEFIVPPAARSFMAGFMRELMNADKTLSAVNENVTRDGRIVLCEWHDTALRDEAGAVVGLLAMVQDVTERQRQEAAIQQQLTMLNALFAQAHQLTETLDPAQVAASVARQCVQTFGARLAWLGEAEPDGRVEVLAHFPPEADYPRQIRVRWDNSPEGYGPSGRALRERGPVIATDLDGPAHAPLRPAAQARGFRASAAFPLISQERPLGILNLYSDQADFFSPDRVALFQAFAQQAAAALANARLFQSVTEQREQLRGLATRLAEVEEAQRRSLARELHDRAGANLTALNISLTLVSGNLSPETRTVVGPRLDDALQLLQETMIQVRDVMMDLRPSVLDDYGLLAGLRWYAEQLGRRTGLAIVVAGAEPDPRLPAAAETTLFRVAQEALTNVVKHARAARVEVRLEIAGGRARLTIADDGVGFDPGLIPAGGWGMVNMRERTEALGGRFRVEARPGQGTEVSVEVDR